MNYGALSALIMTHHKNNIPLVHTKVTQLQKNDKND